ncbi:MAG: hypothetical protein K6F85_04590 [Bacteroidales bacterium]|nr:hypothetical protein [Bacteroidales bacterium]
MKHSFIIIILLLANVAAWGAKRLPPWMNELPKAGNSTIMYVREAGEGATLNEAHNQALLRVMQSTANRIGRPFDIQTVDEALAGGTDYQTLSRQYNIPVNKVDQYDEQLRDGTYRVWVLCQVAVSGNIQPQWEELRREGEVNNWTSLAKSAVVPGLGQMGKGYTAEGLITLGSELLLVGTGVGCYFMAQNQLDIMRDANTTYADWNAAQNSYNTIQTVSYIACGAAAVIYVFNLYRAFSMQPKRTTGIAFAPSVLPSDKGLAPTLSLTFNF